jgi:hypothetical protein
VVVMQEQTEANIRADRENRSTIFDLGNGWDGQKRLFIKIKTKQTRKKGRYTDRQKNRIII